MILKLFKISLICLASLFCIISCNNETEEEIKANLVNTHKHAALVKTICGSCHTFVNPSLLTQSAWINTVLPAMGPRLGIYEYNGQPYEKIQDDESVAYLFPKKPTIKIEDWAKIYEYFTDVTSDVENLQERTSSIQPDINQFVLKSVNMPPIPSPVTSYLHVNPTGGFEAGIADNSFSSFYCNFNSTLQMVKQTKLVSQLTSICNFKGKSLGTIIGSMGPSNLPLGFIYDITGSTPVKFVDKLIRPVDIKAGSLITQNSTDLLVAEFGYLKGQLYILKDGNKNNKVVLRDFPGCIKTQIIDWNKDGKQDIVALFTQGNESLTVFQNNGNGTFSPIELLGFPPVYGSSSFEIEDINKDGLLDIVYTSGDNADYSIILKKFHGVYIYLNSAKGLTQSYFYPIHGAYKSLTADYDGDGDLDMVVISFFADYLNQPQEAIVFLQNTGKTYVASTITGCESGRWLVADKGDIDMDGDLDIVLGNFSLGPKSHVTDNMYTAWQEASPLFIMENKLK